MPVFGFVATKTRSHTDYKHDINKVQCSMPVFGFVATKTRSHTYYKHDINKVQCSMPVFGFVACFVLSDIILLHLLCYLTLENPMKSDQDFISLQPITADCTNGGSIFSSRMGEVRNVGRKVHTVQGTYF